MSNWCTSLAVRLCNEEVAAVIFEEPVAEVEEELGWFAWIIEFIARLFRF